MACRILLRNCCSSNGILIRSNSATIVGFKNNFNSRGFSVVHSNYNSNSASKAYQNEGSVQRFSLLQGQFRDSSRCLIHTSTLVPDIFNIQDEADFKKKVINSKKTVIVEFHATWCGPCKLLMPRMEQSLAHFKDTVDMAKIDIDEHPELAMEFNVGAVPSVLAIKNGEVVDKFVGLKDVDQIDTFVTNAAKQ